MLDTADIERRKPVWIALSEFYLDTELQQTDFERIAAVLLVSGYNWEEIKKIDKYEVFPVLQINLLRVASVWSGFEEEWLVETITRRLARTSSIKRVFVEVYYWKYKDLCRTYWQQLEIAYKYIISNKLKQS